MSNSKKRNNSNQGQQVVLDKDGNPINVDPGNIPQADPGDGVDTEPKGLVGFFVKIIRGINKVVDATPKPVKAAVGIGVTVGGLYLAGKAGYGMAERKYKPLIPTTDDSDEEYSELEGSDDTESLEDQGYQRFDIEGTTVYTDDPEVAEMLSTPEEGKTAE